ncbi:MAG: hypothetical protein L0G87_01480 [Renibacterium salmoninarum]|nr:hypothetical protein [Renibacterium salmoninarum]
MANLDPARQLARVRKLRTAGWTGPQIAEDMQLSLSRVDALLQKSGFSGRVKQPERHGIPARWKTGCRCELCKNASREYRQAEYQSARQRAIKAWEAGEHLPGPLCPCPDCRKAAAVKLTARLERTQSGAVEHGQPWTADEDEKALDRSFKIEDIARNLGRTYAAVANRRRHLARKLKTQGELDDTLDR